MLNVGVYLAPSLYEAGFISNAHDERDIELTLDRAGYEPESAIHSFLREFLRNFIARNGMSL